jgi:hypothetical protein
MIVFLIQKMEKKNYMKLLFSFKDIVISVHYAVYKGDPT